MRSLRTCIRPICKSVLRISTARASHWKTRANAAAYDARALLGQLDIIYNFGQGMIDDKDIEISESHISIPGFNKKLSFRKDERFKDMLD